MRRRDWTGQSRRSAMLEGGGEGRKMEGGSDIRFRYICVWGAHFFSFQTENFHTAYMKHPHKGFIPRTPRSKFTSFLITPPTAAPSTLLTGLGKSDLPS